MDAKTRKRMAECLVFADLDAGITETQALLRAYEEVVEAAGAVQTESISNGHLVKIPACYVANLDQALARLEALKA